MRFLPALAGALLLVSCGEPIANKASEEAPAATADGENGGLDSVLLDSTQNLPDWLLIARQAGGGEIFYNQRTIVRGDGEARIWVQVRYGTPQAWSYETESAETTIRYQLERLHYRFDCPGERFMITERQIVDANEQIVGRSDTPQVWRDIQPGGAADQVWRTACMGR